MPTKGDTVCGGTIMIGIWEARDTGRWSVELDDEARDRE